ncbi:MAG: DUF523 and DUF1722 domain-containing protein [Proteobacteria bacterium]|nr:DUF523 and DUF1722 domain-containing protein [Pseudomonadota bacterium]MBU1059444.1 DUF523 and DUF1722 domain-containing protein [Pseudomonadota bacterium]
MDHTFPRPRVLVSRCLGFEACRYDGAKLFSKVVTLLQDHVDFVDVCPEMEAGLGVPRPPVRLCFEKEKVEVWQPAKSRLVTTALVDAATRQVKNISECDGAILKSRSPSCALFDAKVYSGIEQPQFLRWESGVFGKMVLAYLGKKAVDDEQRLTNIILREHFLVKLYTWARFRSISAKPTIGELVNFHASHKLLFLAYNQSRFRVCGRITANHEKLPVADVFQFYETELGKILAKPFRRQSMVNTLYHAYGWISEKMSSEEKHYIISTFEEYRDERIPLQAATRLIEAQAIRFQREYLLSQHLLHPFPGELSDLSDSGKGREVG